MDTVSCTRFCTRRLVLRGSEAGPSVFAHWQQTPRIPWSRARVADSDRVDVHAGPRLRRRVRRLVFPRPVFHPRLCGFPTAFLGAVTRLGVCCTAVVTLLVCGAAHVTKRYIDRRLSVAPMMDRTDPTPIPSRVTRSSPAMRITSGSRRHALALLGPPYPGAIPR